MVRVHDGVGLGGGASRLYELCSAGRALTPLAVVSELAIAESTDSASVRLAGDASVSEADVNRVLVVASRGSGHAYRVRPGSWRLVS